MKSNNSNYKLEILHRLKKHYPNAKTALDFRNPVEMLVSTILSAQCTDKRVNELTKTLFKKYRNARDFMHSNPEELEKDIMPAGFYRNKARAIIGAATMIEDKFDGKVPKTMDEILKLPGVARKTANVVLSEAYGVIDGIAVDTHVIRLSKRLALSKQTTPEKIEKDLMNTYPRSDWYTVCNTLISHGREICNAKKPKCGECFLSDICLSAFNF